MIIVKVHGGLGNQLFQYSFALYLSKVLKKDVRLDIRTESKSERITNRNSWLLTLDNDSIVADVTDLTKFKFFNTGFLSRIERKLYQIFPILNNKYIVEKSVHQPNVVALSQDDGYFDGYWQTYFYPDKIRELIVTKLESPALFEGEFEKQCGLIDVPNSVSLHIRRGDYYTIKANTKIYAPCGVDYYKRAVGYLRERNDKLSFFVFTDDPEWVVSNFTWLDYQLVAGNSALTDLRLMSRCKYNIIANSTFSWWAAWLNQNDSPLVICPVDWYVDKSINTDKFIPENWIKL